MSRRMIRRRPQGFTLIELVIVIAVIAILAALLVNTILAQAERARKSAAMADVNELVKTFKRFHTDTGAWPSGPALWDPTASSPPAAVDPAQFTIHDTLLFQPASLTASSNPNNLPACSQAAPGYVCFNGPYLPANSGSGTALGSASMFDPWGNALYYTLQLPQSAGGTNPDVPNGVVVIWSAGPDGLDQTGCSNSGCARNWTNIVQGLPSVPGADDIIGVAGSAM